MMRQITKLVFFIFLIAIHGCEDKNCEEYLCTTPPSAFIFELVDKSTGENLFTNGTYDHSEIEVLSSNTDTPQEFTFITDNNLNLLSINSIGWQSETETLLINISNENIFNLYVEAELVSEDCCSFTRYHEIRIENCDFDIEPTTGYYQILIE